MRAAAGLLGEEGTKATTRGVPEGVRMRREQCGSYEIVASACRLPDLKWQPRLAITRLASPKTLSKSQAFPGLSPSFDNSKAATQFALELGRQLARERSSRLTV
ncbi:MAG: hypothetical protein R3357_03425 [Burkholderiales bacterium]|nr:hypothetical protein [Burkholderiales bacterium]